MRDETVKPNSELPSTLVPVLDYVSPSTGSDLPRRRWSGATCYRVALIIGILGIVFYPVFGPISSGSDGHIWNPLGIFLALVCIVLTTRGVLLRIEDDPVSKAGGAFAVLAVITTAIGSVHQVGGHLRGGVFFDPIRLGLSAVAVVVFVTLFVVERRRTTTV